MSDPTATTGRPGYRAFISYSHQDSRWADWLHKALETWRVPKRLIGTRTASGVVPARLAPIFRDRDELASAHDLGRKVNEALAQSANLIVICSPAAAASRWVNEEVLEFKRLGRSEHIFCLIVDGEPNASDLIGHSAEECFCPALRHPLGADGELAHEHAEPVAADARPGKDGRGNAKLKLIAGMLDIGFDALKQREQHRRAQRMTAIAALAIVVMAVTMVLAVAALISRHEAVIAKAAAERRQKQAEDMVGFMLGDLGDKLDQVHRLDIMQAVDDKAMAYFESLPAADASDAALAMRVTALEKIGSVRMDQGHIPAAREAYQAASTLAGELARRAPNDIARKAAYADSLKWIGQADWYQGDLANALDQFERAVTLLQQAHSAKPDDTDLSFKLAAVRNNSGHVCETRGDFTAAQVDYEATLALYRELALREPGKTKWQSYLGDAWNNLGKLALERGQLDRAIEDYRKDQGIKASLAAREPDNHDALENLLISNAILGRTLGLCGDIDAALHYTEQAVSSAKVLTAFDPTYAYGQKYFALYSQQLGGLLRQRGLTDAAGVANGTALHVFGALMAKDSSDADWQQLLAQSQLEAARLQLANGDPGAAESLVKPAFATLMRSRTSDSINRNLTLLAAQAHVVLGQIAAKRNDLASARADWQLARDMIAPAERVGADPNFLATYATTLLLLDEKDVAQPVLAKLAQIGYRTPDFVALLAGRKIAYTVDADAARRITAAMQADVPESSIGIEATAARR